MNLRLCSMLLICASLAFGAGLPIETTVTTATKIEILRDGNLSGSIGLPVGAKLDVITLDGDYVQVRYRSLSGRVKAVHTELAELAAAMNQMPVAPTVVSPPVTTTAAPAVKPVVSSTMARRLQGKLVQLQGSALKPQDPARLNRVQFYALYYSAAWCGPCRQFTPRLVNAYQELRAAFPEFEVVFISADQSSGDMQKYMVGDKMAWPALRFDLVRQSGEIMRYSGDGIPCLVLVDAAGRVLSDSYRDGNYVGPQTVLNDTRRILQQHRAKHPRPST